MFDVIRFTEAAQICKIFKVSIKTDITDRQLGSISAKFEIFFIISSQKQNYQVIIDDR